MVTALKQLAYTVKHSGLRRAEAVETAGIIGPLRIAEIGRTAGERVRLHRLFNALGTLLWRRMVV